MINCEYKKFVDKNEINKGKKIVLKKIKQVINQEKQ